MKILTREERRRIAFRKKVLKTFLCSIICSVLVLCGYLYINKEDFGVEIPILTYHNVQLKSNNIYEVDEERFYQDMEYLKGKGYTPLLPSEFIDIIDGRKKMPLKPIIITFDDGYYGNYEYAYPIIKKSGMKATIGVISNNLYEEPNHQYLTHRLFDVYAPATQEEIQIAENTIKPTFMSWQQCMEMYESGVIAIESHTHNLHNPETGGSYVEGGVNGIKRLKGEEETDYYIRVKADLEKSVETIESKIGNDVKYFSYPYGVVDKYIFRILEELDIRMATTTINKIAQTEDDLFKLSRININMENSVAEVLSRKKATLSTGKIYVDSNANKVDTYNIEGTHYMKLRDFESILKDTNKEFAIEWNNETKQINLEPVINNGPLQGALDNSPKEEKTLDYRDENLENNLQLDSQVLKLSSKNKEYEIEVYSIDSGYYVRAIDLNIILELDMAISSNGDKVQIVTQ